MSHLTDQFLHEYLAGTLPPTDSATVNAHLGACDQCQARLISLKAAWDALETWETPALRTDLASVVLARAQTRESRSWAMRVGGGWMRVAAMLLLSTGVGISSWLWNEPGNRAALPGAEDAARSLHLEAFQNGSPAGLAEQVLAPPTTRPAATREVR